MVLGRRYVHRRCRPTRMIVLCTVMILGYVTMLFTGPSKEEHRDEFWKNDGEIISFMPNLQTRHLLANGSLYPDDVFSREQRLHGAIILHISGMIYMFIALAIVCDEFFIPALGVITEKLELSDDVAGATFMAAGGSVPELCTSIIGVFVSASDVGIGTIVGSAVFNILFVIGMCAVFSKGVLELTWWPLFRDVFFYILSIIILLLCFKDSLIDWFESLVLLMMYFFYVLFMKFNHTIESFVKGLLNRNRIKNEPGEKKVNGHNGRTRSMPILCAGPLYRHGALQLMLHTLDPLSDSTIDQKAKNMSAIAKSPPRKKPITNGKSQLNSTDSTSFNASQGSLTCFVNAETVPGQMSNGDQMTISTSANSSTQLQNAEISGEVNLGVSETNFDNGYMNGNLNTGVEEQLDTVQQECDLEEEEEPLDISWPDSTRRRITYVLLAPLVFPMWLTIPDVRRPDKKKYFIVTFIVALLFIAVFSYLMVWWATVVGQTFGISDPVMGLTFIAAGTSIPDLITSVIVARKGLGDMAVSSSVGSNIFDVTIGLPFPWMLYYIIYWEPAKVYSDNLFCSILLLFGMIVFVMIMIIACKWRMTKMLGASMFMLYAVFLTVALLFETSVLDCPF
ncbi:sodium/potassium/calcium exchanger 1-like [Anneissia japonica]|uniref:sodium/potassium/calcium exchanger 1-like n=1 Tax=Anneissia japonica TaxID=1529436 RepID=UPI0014257ACE|nr:sodium/potassium/calcium exchanger 1-like [Anneissia japonica]XP_033108831.1 sodium/potassium/calcium exchanger 1-like [Anneissia japonica]